MTEYIVRSVTLPKDLAEFAEAKIKRLAKETGEPANMSKYVRDLIRADKSLCRRWPMPPKKRNAPMTTNTPISARPGSGRGEETHNTLLPSPARLRCSKPPRKETIE